MTTAKFQDPRAKAIAQQIDAINQAAYSQAHDPIFQHHLICGGLSSVEGVLRFDMFLSRTKEAAKKRSLVWESQVNPFGEFKIINSKFKIEEINGGKTIQNYQFKIQNYFFFILHFAFCILNSRRGLTTNLRPSNQRL
ncbi:MAG: hypothetical protein AB3A66_29720 (plasmid) [Nodularia sp. CChRGM 3473]